MDFWNGHCWQKQLWLQSQEMKLHSEHLIKNIPQSKRVRMEASGSPSTESWVVPAGPGLVQLHEANYILMVSFSFSSNNNNLENYNIFNTLIPLLKKPKLQFYRINSMLWATEMVNGLNILKIIRGLLSVANCAKQQVLICNHGKPTPLVSADSDSTVTIWCPLSKLQALQSDQSDWEPFPTSCASSVCSIYWALVLHCELRPWRFIEKVLGPSWILWCK